MCFRRCQPKMSHFFGRFGRRVLCRPLTWMAGSTLLEVPVPHSFLVASRQLVQGPTASRQGHRELKEQVPHQAAPAEQAMPMDATGMCGFVVLGDGLVLTRKHKFANMEAMFGGPLGQRSHGNWVHCRGHPLNPKSALRCFAEFCRV